MPDIQLHGCTPEPLMNYLKAIGVLRIVAEQKDKNAKGRWKDGVFWLRSELDEEGLVKFFLEDYKPTPVIVPWSGADFFDVNINGDKGPFRETPTSTKIIESFLATDSSRLEEYREAIKCAVRTLNLTGIVKKSHMEKKKTKSKYISLLRSIIDNNSVKWIDTCAVLTDDKALLNTMLGSGGGSDGNTHFSDNFMQNLWDILPVFDSQKLKIKDVSENILRNSIFKSISQELIPKRTSTLYDSGAVGGPNASQGFERISLGNPWSIVLCIEGTMKFAGNLSKKHTVSTGYQASFPFQTHLSVIASTSTSNNEVLGSEIWLPIWLKWTSLIETDYLFSEGRANSGKKQAEYGVDFAIAASTLGIDRGIESFKRYGIVKGRVGGNNYNTSINLGQFNVRARPDADLIREIDKWLDKFRRATSDKNAPPRFKSALRRIETAIFEYCQFGENHRFQEILCALGKVEKELALTEGKVGKDYIVKPISKLSPEWIKASNDKSVEFEIALSLASIWDKEMKIGPIRANLEPVTWKGHPEWKGYVSWCKKGKSVIWNNADLKDNLTAVLERRILDGNRSNCSTIPLSYSRGVSLEALSKFISGEVDDDRIAELLWGLMLIDHWKKHPVIHYNTYEALPIPRAFALLKMLYIPYDIKKNGTKLHVKTEERILPLLRSDRPGEACVIAAQRLRNSGILSMPHTRNSKRDHEWTEAIDGLDYRRIAAALSIPAHHNTIDRLMKLVVRPEKELPVFEVKKNERRD